MPPETFEERQRNAPASSPATALRDDILDNGLVSDAANAQARIDQFARRRLWASMAPRRPLQRKVMASPPVPTYTTASTIAGGRTIAPASSDTIRGGTVFTYYRAPQPGFGASFPDTFTTNHRSVTQNLAATPNTSNAFATGFYHTGRYLEIRVKDVAQRMLLKIDDEYVSLTPQTATNTGNTYFWYFDLATFARRRIEFLSTGYGGFQGIRIEASGTVEPLEIRGPRVIVVGDSFVEGSGATALGASSCAYTFADAMGWDDVWNSGVGGTGYLATNSGTKKKLRDRLITDVLNHSPDIVIFANGVNDASSAYAAMKAEVAAVLAQTRAALPNAFLMNVGPFWRSGPNQRGTGSNLYSGTLRGIKEAFAEAGAYSAPAIEMPLPDGFVQPVGMTVAVTTAVGNTQVDLSGTVEIPAETTVMFPDYSRAFVKSSTAGNNIITLDGTLQTAVTAGDAVTVVGNSLWTGGGYVGATTAWGNSDVLVSSDATHPSQLGHDVIGQYMAAQLIRALNS